MGPVGRPRCSLGAFFLLICITVSVSSYNQAQNIGPSTQPETYFNGSSYLRLQTTISLKKMTGLSFRTCSGGNLFSQQQNDDLIKLSVDAVGVDFYAKTAGKSYEEKLPGNFLNNRWHVVHLQYELGNLTMDVDGQRRMIANSTFRNELLTSPGLYNEGASVLLIGKQFNGCLLEGPSIVFDNTIITSSHNVRFGKCPIPEDSCTPKEYMKGTDYCVTEPCMRHGTCINGLTGYTCSCLPRYTGKNCEFDIGNPCDKNPPVCRNGANCTAADISGEYTCICPPGYTGRHCDEEVIIHQKCKNSPCENGATCLQDETGALQCICLDGFEGPKCQVNVDECRANSCKNGGVCIDGFNNYTCDCSHTGYTGRFCEININECLSNPCKNHGTCFDTYGTYLCQCAPGFGGFNCQNNLNECTSQPCINGRCSDRPDGYECTCLKGFTGQNCEIEERPGTCDHNTCSPYADCIPRGDSVSCVCKPQYSGIYPNCTGESLCLNNNPCKNGGICSESGGTFSCACQAGYTGPACERYSLCKPGVCHNGGTCVNDTFLTYHCVCSEGWTGPTCDVAQVVPIACADNPCQNAIFCQEYLDGYFCTCEAGWTGQNCNVKLELCSSNPCLNGATCVDHVDLYSCQCPPGFAGKFCQHKIEGCSSVTCSNGGICVETNNGPFCNCTDQWMGPTCDKPYDICELKPCMNNGTCVTSANKHDFSCNCLPGFSGDRCETNIDDCMHIRCPTGRICVDLVNGYKCKCPPGYSGENCTVDTDPCARDPCPPNTHCQVDRNTHQFTCACPPGYKGPNCDEDIDECNQEVKPCVNGICVNKKGTYQCYCEPGYTGERCSVDVDECLSEPCRNGGTCINKVNNYECICPPGYTEKDCSVDIDECQSNPCLDGSTCINGINEFTCVCQAGLTGRICEINIDDCDPNPCLNGAPCIDGLNNYTCNCNDTGYMGRHCDENIDDCIGNPCQNGADCVDEVKDYRCKCYEGYAGKNCDLDVNECESNPCQYGGTCLEKSNMTLYQPSITHKLNVTLPEAFDRPFDYSNAAGYECLCVPGITGISCEININECESSPCFQGTCVDKIGYYVCECEEGFEGERCDIDIDECEKYKPCAHGKCVDKKANYFCECEPNYGGKNCSVELIGCLDNPCLNNGSCLPYLVNENEHKFNCSCPNGFHGAICEKISTMSLSGNSLVMINISREEGYDIQFRFKTTLGDGLLALGKGVTYYILELSKGRLNLHSSLLNKWEGVFIGSNLNDSNWQRVFVAINSTHLVLSANDEQTIYPITNNNDNSNASLTSFPLTYIGGIPSNLRKLAHGQPFLVGCTEDVHVNGEWVLPENKDVSWLTFQNVDTGCLREPQCNPNPCHSGGHCTDMWRDFSCTCERPYLGNTCQYNYTAATFGYENITDSLVTVNVADSARRAVRTIVDISMFIRTRQTKGQIFYLGSALGSSNLMDETYIAAQLEGGELLVRIQFNGTPEAYTVGGVKLNNGYNHLIEVIRNVTLVQVKLNGTEYFRKTISATGTLDAQVLFLGGQPQLRPVRQASENVVKVEVPTAAASVTPLSNIHFKGIIQDVQISNGSSVMVVEFFPLQADDLQVPMPFGTVTFDNSTVLEGVLSDNSCKVNVCHHNGTCENTWNDYRCICPRGFKGKDCADLEFCEIEECPTGSECRNLEDGHECLSNATFDGRTLPIQYTLSQSNHTRPVVFDTLELTYRTRSWGTAFFAKNKDDYFVVFIYHNEVVVEWSIKHVIDTRRFRKDHFEGQWLTLYFIYRDSVLKGGFKDAVMDEAPNFEVAEFDFAGFTSILKYGVIYLAGSDNQTFDYQNAISSADGNMTGYIPVSDITTAQPLSGNSLEMSDFYSQDVLLYKVDQNKKTDAFKGCLGEVRIGGLLLPFFTIKELYPKNHHLNEFFELVPNTIPQIGCLLCYHVDCFNQGFCINPIDTYKCNCTDGYTADDCSIDINECENNQCQNNATCVDLVAKYECECLPGYEGVNCEKDIDECLSDPCRHGGTCIDLIGSFKCDCPEDYVGKQCEAPLLITCDNKPCAQGSACKTGYNEATGNNFTCNCTPGMEGPLCDTAFCLKKHCEKGYCNTTGDVPFCHCQRGFEGKYCEVDIDDCISPAGGSHCQNGGICIDGINRYDCNCTGTGYTGLLCEMDIDECRTNRMPCGRGNCINTPGTYRCACDEPGKCGHFCALDDLCEMEHPCVHGDCIPQCLDNSDYICNCHDNYTGKNCTEIKVAESQTSDGVNILYIIIPIVLILIIAFAIGMAVLVNIARSKRATRGTYSPSAQEFCNPRVELDHVLKPPPEERLI